MSGGNQHPYQGQRYRLTYPEKNAVWWSDVPGKCTQERQSECCHRMAYTPTPKSQCNSTFMPGDRPDPYQCLKMCKGIDALKVNGCQAQQMQNAPRRINNNGCLREPSVMEYTNVPLGTVKNVSILDYPNRNPPPPPQYGEKYSNAYDPILWEYGDAYTY